MELINKKKIGKFTCRVVDNPFHRQDIFNNFKTFFIKLEDNFIICLGKPCSVRFIKCPVYEI